MFMNICGRGGRLSQSWWMCRVVLLHPLHNSTLSALTIGIPGSLQLQCNNPVADILKYIFRF
jgi:hypothetical protein